MIHINMVYVLKVHQFYFIETKNIWKNNILFNQIGQVYIAHKYDRLEIRVNDIFNLGYYKIMVLKNTRQC